MTWRAFKAAVEARGLEDEEEVSWIDWTRSHEPQIVRYPDGSVMVQNGKHLDDIAEDESWDGSRGDAKR